MEEQAEQEEKEAVAQAADKSISNVKILNVSFWNLLVLAACLLGSAGSFSGGPV